MSENIVILSSYTVYCSLVDAKAFGWASMIPLSHMSFAQGGQVKCRPKKKVSNSVLAEGTVCVLEGWGGGGGVQMPSGTTGISALSLI